MPHTAPEQRRSQVAVIGGGVSGLACANALTIAGIDVTVCEARPRIGGRIHTFRGTDGFPVELGAQVVHGTMNPVWTLLPGGAAPSAYRDGAATVRRGGTRSPMSALLAGTPPWAVEQRLVAEHGTAEPASGSVSEWLRAQDLDVQDRATAAEWMAQGWAGEPRELCAAGLATVRRAERVGAGQHVLPGGFDALAAALADGLDVRTDTAVHAVRWRRGAVTLVLGNDRDDRRELRADAVVVTVPPPVVATGALLIDPLPPAKRVAAAALRLGDACCAVLAFDRPAPRGEVCFDADGHGGFARATEGRPHVVLVAKSAAAGRLRTVLDSRTATAELAGSLLPWTGQARLVDVVVADWGRDPFARGAFTGPRTGATDAPAAWAAPLEHTVFFAGEATAEQHQPATVHGALASGRRAAREVLEALQ